VKYIKLFESFKTNYPIQIPPADKQDCIKLIIENQDLPVYIENVEVYDKDIILDYLNNEMSECGTRHETLHDL
jgi:hypothetical protein